MQTRGRHPRLHSIIKKLPRPSARGVHEAELATSHPLLLDNRHRQLFSSPAQPLAVRPMKEVDPVGAFDRSTSILDHSPSPARDMHPRAKGIVVCVCSNRSIPGWDIPWQDELERDRPRPLQSIASEEALTRHAGHGTRCSFSGVGFAFSSPFAHIAVPDIQFQEFPTPPLPFAARSASAIRRGRDPALPRACTS